MTHVAIHFAKGMRQKLAELCKIKPKTFWLCDPVFYYWATDNSVVDYGSSMFIFDKHPAHCYGQKCWKPLAKWSRKESKEHFNPFIPKRNWLLISLGSITAESSTKVMRIKEMIINSRCSRLLKKILLSYHRKCIENSRENMNTDARV